MPQSASRVFLNVPFDRPYEPIFIGLVGALIHLGKYPTTVLELGGGAAPANMASARRLVRRLGQVANRLKREHRADTVFSRTMCNELIDMATRLRDQ